MMDAAKHAARSFGRALSAVDSWLNRHTWFLPLVAVLLMGAIFLTVLATVEEVAHLQSGQHSDAIANCERSNIARVANVANLRHDRSGLESDINFARAAAPPSIARGVYIREKSRLVFAKTDTIRATIAAQSSYAIKPGSPVVNCIAANASQ